MSHFYSCIAGAKGPSTRCGSKTSGIAATVTGWDLGAQIVMRYDKTLDTDVVEVRITHGSNTPSSSSLLAEFYRSGDTFHCLRTNFPELVI